MIWVPNQLVGAPPSTDVTIDCHTEAHPRYVLENRMNHHHPTNIPVSMKSLSRPLVSSVYHKL